MIEWLKSLLARNDYSTTDERLWRISIHADNENSHLKYTVWSYDPIEKVWEHKVDFSRLEDARGFVEKNFMFPEYYTNGD